LRRAGIGWTYFADLKTPEFRRPVSEIEADKNRATDSQCCRFAKTDEGIARASPAAMVQECDPLRISHLQMRPNHLAYQGKLPGVRVN
jgi:hypothetical protein